jgi:hypothetical protein
MLNQNIVREATRLAGRVQVLPCASTQLSRIPAKPRTDFR